jgi:hypothetical protein
MIFSAFLRLSALISLGIAWTRRTKFSHKSFRTRVFGCLRPWGVLASSLHEWALRLNVSPHVDRESQAWA